MKVKIKIYSSFILRLKNILASGIEIRNGICTKRKCEMIFKKAINQNKSKLNENNIFIFLGKIN